MGRGDEAETVFCATRVNFPKHVSPSFFHFISIAMRRRFVCFINDDQVEVRGGLARFNIPLKPEETPVLTTRSRLTKGQKLEPSQFIRARTSARGKFLVELDDTVELHLVNDVDPQKPIQYTDLERDQVVAAVDIPIHTPITEEMLKTERTTYDPEAYLYNEVVVGQLALRKIAKDEVVLEGAIGPKPVMEIVVAANMLSPYQVIRCEDLEKTRLESGKVPPTGVFSDRNDLVGRFPLKKVSQSDYLLQDQVSTVKLVPDELHGRKIISLLLEKGSFSSAATPGQSVVVIFSPRPELEKSIKPLQIEDALILAVNSLGDNTEFVFAVKHLYQNRLAKVLGSTRVFLLQEAPGSERAPKHEEKIDCDSPSDLQP